MRFSLLAVVMVAVLGSTAHADDTAEPSAGAYEWTHDTPGLADDAFTNVFGAKGRIVRDSLVLHAVRLVESSRPIRFDRDIIRCCICAMMDTREIKTVEPTKFLGADEDLLQLRLARGAFGH